ncbi:hypothetical protein ABIB40_000035 [Pedobacter sp. UYP30]|uniref:hypothetical protein n=1 Tax=Pedobacter sp. UYP30 TaxID=1756400 RepID=UPI00339521DF
MIYATKPQVQKINILLIQLGLKDEKSEVISNFTEGRTVHSSKMSIEEARNLLLKLSEYSPDERIKSLIFSLAYQSGIIYGSTPEDKRMNTAKLNLFLKERGTVKKELKEMTYAELIKTHRQFEGIVRNTTKSADNKNADKLVRSLLGELSLTTIKN